MMLGALIAGGRATRFGDDKALALLDGRPLWRHVADALGRDVDALVVCGRTLPGLVALSDRPAAGLGPLGGIAAALAHAAAGGYAGVLSCPCDTPRLPPHLAERLVGDTPAYAADCPVIGWWPATLADDLDARLAGSSDRSLRGWIARCGARGVDVGRIANVNRPEDLALLER